MDTLGKHDFEHTQFIDQIKNHPKVELIYDDDVDTSAIHNIMLISDSVSAHQLFVDSANANTFTIVYSHSSDSTLLLQLLQRKFNNINRISFVFHDPLNQQKTFLDSKPFFTDDDLIFGQTTFSHNFTFLQNLISYFRITNLDFLACNSLLYDNWKTYYTLLALDTNVVVGASDNLSGNIKYGADWVMENTNENIKTIYFNDNIHDFSGYLQTTDIPQDGGTILFRQEDGTNEIQYKLDGPEAQWTTVDIANFPINIINTPAPADNNVLTVQFTTNMTFSDPNQYFICGSEYITFDGLNQDVKATITFENVTNCLGLIRNATVVVNPFWDEFGNGFGNITVQNIHVASSGSTTLDYGAGWVCQKYFGKGSSNVLIDNCSSSGEIGPSAGGICGGFAGDNGTATISNCYSEGPISGEGSGGICGLGAGYGSGTANISNCYSTGDIGDYASGICGSNAGNDGGTANISNCYSEGPIGPSAGGICGRSAGYGGTARITNCYSEGPISGQYAGGICGVQAGRNGGTATISNCYSEGPIGTNAGGICGAETGYEGTVNISNCYSLYATGNDNKDSGGMVGPFSYNVNFSRTYGAGGTWNSVTADGLLLGTPKTSDYGPVWSYSDGDPNDPYILTVFAVIITGVVVVEEDYIIVITGTNFIDVTQVTINPESTPIILTSASFTINLEGTSITATLSSGVLVTSVSVSVDDEDSNTFVLPPYPISITCFPAGTPIHTNQGIVSIDKINTNIHTIRGKPIVAITKTITHDKYLVCFEQNALGNNIPSQQTIITQNHLLFYNGKMIKANDLLGKYKGVKKVKYTGQVLYNVLLENHDKMLVNNLICETLHPQNKVARLYNILNQVSATEQSNLIQIYNDRIIKNKLCATK